jgi:magnesium transporter
MRSATKSRAKANLSKSSKKLLRANKKLSLTRHLPPGTLVHVGERTAEKVRISLMQYDANEVNEVPCLTAEQILKLPESKSNLWIHVEGLQDLSIVESIGKRFGLHPLVLEDLVNTAQRPKAEDSGDYMFFVIKMLHYTEDTCEMESEQMGFVLGSRFLLTFRESQGCEFNDLRGRITSGKGRVRTSGVDYLAYCLVDTVVDDYFVSLEKLAERIEVLEEDLVTDPSPDTLELIHRLKTDMIFLRRSIWPLREIVNRLIMSDGGLVQHTSVPYWRDVYDHTIHAIETMETYREILSGMLDIYLSSMSNRLNQTMKVLTLIATVFIPLTFMTGWYGMNFKNMPELQWAWGYPGFAGLVGLVVAFILTFFRRNKWI